MNASVLATRPARVPRRLAYAATAALVVVTAAMLVGSAVRSGGGDHASDAPTVSSLSAERQAFERFEDELQPILDSGAFLVAQGMRPGLTDIAQGAFDDPTLLTMAEGWVGSVESLEERFAVLTVPAFLSEYATAFERALAAYRDVATRLRAAASATGEERARLVDQVAPLGERADELYDEAEAILDRHRRRLMLDDEPARRSPGR